MASRMTLWRHSRKTYQSSIEEAELEAAQLFNSTAAPRYDTELEDEQTAAPNMDVTAIVEVEDLEEFLVYEPDLGDEVEEEQVLYEEDNILNCNNDLEMTTDTGIENSNDHGTFDGADRNIALNDETLIEGMRKLSENLSKLVGICRNVSKCVDICISLKDGNLIVVMRKLLID